MGQHRIKFGSHPKGLWLGSTQADMKPCISGQGQKYNNISSQRRRSLPFYFFSHLHEAYIVALTNFIHLLPRQEKNNWSSLLTQSPKYLRTPKRTTNSIFGIRNPYAPAKDHCFDLECVKLYQPSSWQTSPQHSLYPSKWRSVSWH